MKSKVLLISLIINIILLSIFYFYHINIEDKRNINSSTNNKKIEVNSVNNDICKDIISGKNSKNKDFKKDLVIDYFRSKKIINYNEYENIFIFKQGNCNILKDKTKNACKAYKNKDLSLLKLGGYDYWLVKSLIDNKDYCEKLKIEVVQCKKIFKEFMNPNRIKYSGNNILGISVFEKGKILKFLGREKYLDLLNKNFYSECMK